MSGLKDKVVIITGASSGIGAETAIQFARVGAKVVLTARSEAKLEETAQKCCEAGLDRSKILIVVGDILKDEDLYRLVDTTVEKYGGIDVLINNAGYGSFHNFAMTSVEDMDEMYKIHVRSPFLLTKLTVPHLLKRKGNVVNVSSVSSLKPMNQHISYSVAKCAQDQFMKAAALELCKDGVRMNSVCPGALRTNILPACGITDEKSADEFFEKTALIHLAKRNGTTDEVAKVIVFLASDDASFVSGVSMPVDSGLCNTINS